MQVEVEVEDSQVHKREDFQVHKRDDSQVHKRVPCLLASLPSPYMLLHVGEILSAPLANMSIRCCCVISVYAQSSARFPQISARCPIGLERSQVYGSETMRVEAPGLPMRTSWDRAAVGTNG